MHKDWFYYDWNMDGAPAEFAVDMELSGAAPFGTHPVLLYIRCDMRNECELSRRALRHIASIEKKCMRQLDPYFVGFIRDALRYGMFFYVSKRKQLQILEEIAQKERYLHCITGCDVDPEWQTYFKLLYPDAARLYTETNRKQIELYKKHGDGITPARRVTLSVFFPTEALVPIFAEEARLSGFAIGESEFRPEYEDPHGVKLQCVSTLNKREIDALTTRAIRIAEKYEGHLEYWESPLVPKKSPLR